MKLVWSHYAIDDRLTIFDYLSMESPNAAIATDQSIEDQAAQLSHFPFSGREGRVKDTRELVVQDTPYIMVYSVKESSVHILRLLHGARKWPSET